MSMLGKGMSSARPWSAPSDGGGDPAAGWRRGMRLGVLGGVARVWETSKDREVAAGSSCATRAGVLCSWRPAGRQGNQRQGKR